MARNPNSYETLLPFILLAIIEVLFCLLLTLRCKAIRARILGVGARASPETNLRAMRCMVTVSLLPADFHFLFHDQRD